MKVYSVLIFVFLFIIFSCGNPLEHQNNVKKQKDSSEIIPELKSLEQQSDSNHILFYYTVQNDVKVKDYFNFMDTLVSQIDTFKNWDINEYILVHANPWILDTLRAYDYYRMMEERDSFVYDQTQLFVLRKSDTLSIPDSIYASEIWKKISTTVIDVNIPEFKLRIYQNGDTLLTCSVRVGRDAKKYLAVAKRKVNLRTPIGVGEIVRVNRNPDYINPTTGKEYKGTNRDDGKFTKMPLIPWLEPTTNGIRYGAMIHPTTNPETLGKAYSHGCIGTTEKDAWTIYYNAPIGTKVIFRYDLKIKGEDGDTITLNDVYHLYD